ncbi:sensor histidine kinase [Idiomarina aminovorans]|uniref:sensor histidine kinase n=1 Tax=Idiomarina aminovorans TaxID=2914829 RepID=UPI002005EF87|nr:histidine kinase [Idiomarina sp. ATCH4]MCK7460489.1 histidine kinase [Idiomarina sp. ATCH4]
MYFIPASLEWLHFDKENLWRIAISLPIWLMFFHIGPFWLFYLLQKTQPVDRLNAFVQGFLYVVIMFIGAHIVTRLHLIAFPDYQFSLEEQFISALLWGVFIFSMTQMYLLYLRFVSEQKLRKEAQWMNLSNRLNPHFLFNSLNTISALIYSSPQKADQVLHQLADILRYSVDQQKEWVSLEQELTICRTYLTIEEARFTENLVINWQLGEELDPASYKVPPMLLQPLIENVVKHVKSRPIELNISVQLEKDSLTFLIKDNGKGFSESVLNEKAQKGQGLDIVKKRVAIAGGDIALFNEGGAVCKISLPVNQCG